MSLSADLWAANADLAAEALAHPFVAGIGNGTLPRTAFAGYVAQDAFFLESFARAYAALLARLDEADVATALTALWTIERTYLDAWSGALPGAPAYREFVEHWTVPGFAGYVAGLAAAADALPAADPEAVFDEVVAAEVSFWDMALAAA